MASYPGRWISGVLVYKQYFSFSGWGRTSYPGKGVANTLMQARMPVVPSKSCKYNPEVVCVGFGKVSGPNACSGDSGGPLMCRNSDNTWTVHGVASFVVRLCKYYTAYSPNSKYLPWIRKYVPQVKIHQWGILSSWKNQCKIDYREISIMSLKRKKCIVFPLNHFLFYVFPV